MKTELLANALGDLDFLIADLRELHGECTPMESLVVGPMIDLAAELRRFAAALEPEGGGE